MVGIRPRSPSNCSASWWGPQPGGSGPAKRRLLDDPAEPAEAPAAPTLQDSAGAANATALTSVVVLATGCALHVPLDDVDLVLEPEPTSILQVNLQGHNLILIPEGLVGATDQRPGSQGDCPEVQELGAFLRPVGENMVIQQGFLCEFIPEIIRQIEAFQEDALEEEFVEQWMDPPAGPQGPIPYLGAWAPTPSPVRRSSNPAYDVDFHLMRPFPTSPLQPLPPSPSSSPQARPQRSPGPRSKACRRLF
ncbi:proline-rich protein 23C-like [Marmota flaviventris]|uniref:proline-rich protein 23C-like n=1 Tax=Marmota flaviventris TaxID=93162 RepID=UPI003A8A8580